MDSNTFEAGFFKLAKKWPFLYTRKDEYAKALSRLSNEQFIAIVNESITYTYSPEPEFLYQLSINNAHKYKQSGGRWECCDICNPVPGLIESRDFAGNEVMRACTCEAGDHFNNNLKVRRISDKCDILGATRKNEYWTKELGKVEVTLSEWGKEKFADFKAREGERRSNEEVLAEWGI